MESVILFNLVALWLIILLVLWLLLYSMGRQRTLIAAQSVSMREPASDAAAKLPWSSERQPRKHVRIMSI